MTTIEAERFHVAPKRKGSEPNNSNDDPAGLALPGPDTTRHGSRPYLTRYRVTVEGWTIKVNAASVYFAAILFNAETLCIDAIVDCRPILRDSTILTVRAFGERQACQIVWRDVLDWANQESEIVFGIQGRGCSSSVTNQQDCNAVSPAGESCLPRVPWPGYKPERNTGDTSTLLSEGPLIIDSNTFTKTKISPTRAPAGRSLSAKVHSIVNPAVPPETQEIREDPPAYLTLSAISEYATNDLIEDCHDPEVSLWSGAK